MGKTRANSNKKYVWHYLGRKKHELPTMPTADKLLIKCEDRENGKLHPQCPHGPTLYFYREDSSDEQGFYACAAARDKRYCNFNLLASELTDAHLRSYDLPTAEYRMRRKRFLQSSVTEQRHFCNSCCEPLLDEDFLQHVGHKVLRNLTPKLLQDPTQFLPPLDNDKIHAQYFFDQKALKFFGQCFKDFDISKVLCIGAPRLHAYLNTQCRGIKSFLLDFDHRFYYFYKDKSYAWFNMCNNFFFDKKQESKYHDFLKCNENERLLIFIDPPFGSRTEPIANTLKQITNRFNHINQLPYQPLPIFWIFPYYHATYIQQMMPALQMCDYKVNYTNHTIFTDEGVEARKLGSPVRIFTNVPLDRLKLPVTEEYKYCASCCKYTALENRHCNKCQECPARNGSTYRHCELCALCVKPSYVHCPQCRRCTQIADHDCKKYQTHQRCWICLQAGHTERNCVSWQLSCKKLKLKRSCNGAKIITCLICGQLGHNERRCKQRNKYLTEITFMGETQVIFKF